MCTLIRYLGFMVVFFFLCFCFLFFVVVFLLFLGLLFYCLVGCFSMVVWIPAVLSVLYACVLHFCTCTCSTHLSMFHMERRSRNTLINLIINNAGHAQWTHVNACSHRGKRYLDTLQFTGTTDLQQSINELFCAQCFHWQKTETHTFCAAQQISLSLSLSLSHTHTHTHTHTLCIENCVNLLSLFFFLNKLC